MTVQEMRQCAEQGEFCRFIIVRNNLPKGERVRLLGRSGPLGQINVVDERKDGRYNIVGCWKSKEVLEFMDRNGL